MNDPSCENSDWIKRATLQLLRSWAAAGITDWPPGTEHTGPWAVRETDAQAANQEPAHSHHPTPPAAAAKISVHSETLSATTDGSLFDAGGAFSYESPSGSSADRSQRLAAIQDQVQKCTACHQLVDCWTQTVFGVGNPQPRLVFFGEGPGADEDRLGEPFVGRAGQLLNKIIEACQMQRDDVYIMNTVKCRPPGNRNPLEEEIENCWPFAEAQFEVLQPEFICCLGSVAARTLLRTKDSVGRLRQKFHRYRDSRVIVTYHPAYLLRTPAAKAKTWEDMKMLMDAMEIPRP